MDISIVIVNYKSKGLTLNCLQSIKQADWSGLRYEVIVVDNNSGDSLGQILAWQNPEVIFIQNQQNLGMGAANNVGLRRATGEFVVMMNPDTLVLPATFRQLRQFLLDQPAVGLVGLKQFNPDQSVQSSCFAFYKLWTPLFRRTIFGRWFGQSDLRRFLLVAADKSQPLVVDWLLGSFLMARAEAWRAIGGFDERFFLYFEDTDLCRRFWQAGWQVMYCPQAAIIHNHNRASAKPWFNNLALRYHLVSWVKYLWKWR